MTDIFFLLALIAMVAVAFVLGCVLDKRRHVNAERDAHDEALPLSHVHIVKGARNEEA